MYRERFTESQIIDIAYQIAVALEHCHGQNVLHRDIKPMNILLETPWDPTTQESVPNLYLADFGIAFHLQTLGTRWRSHRGTKGYKAPELLGQGPAEFSHKSDIYALGCILFYLLTLNTPSPTITDLDFEQISPHYSQDLICIVSAMLSLDRAFRPTAMEVREYLTAHIHTNISSTAKECRTCRRVIFTDNQFKKHTEYCKINSSDTGTDPPIIAKERWWFDSRPGFWDNDEPSASKSGGNRGQNEQVNASHGPNVQMKGSRTQPSQLALITSQPARTISGVDEQADPAPCAACLKRFSPKRQPMNHLYCGHHVRKPKYVQKRLYEYTAAIEGHHEPILRLEDISDRDLDGDTDRGLSKFVDPNIKTSQPQSRKRSAGDDEQPNGFKRLKTQTQIDLQPLGALFTSMTFTTSF
jgi:serine/threonine protein kinase